MILSTADFDAPVWTNKQHLASRFSGFWHVVYVESLGLRTPRPSLKDVKRILRRLLGAKRPTSAPSAIEFVKPRVLPVHGFAPARWINGMSLREQLSGEVKGNVLWTFSPLTYRLDRVAGTVVYHSVDLLHQIPGVPTETLLRAEKELVGRADHVIASSTMVREHLLRQGAKEVLLWENVADTNLYSSLSLGRRSRAIFAGNLTESKIEVEWLLALADAKVPVALAGPIGIDGTSSAAIRKLLDHPNVDYLGSLAPADLAVALNESTVGLIPYQLNQYTSGVFPMKVYEYLAAGLNIASSRLPSLSQLSVAGCAFATTSDEFVQVVRRALEMSPSDIARNRQDASQHSWEHRIAQARDLVDHERE